MYITIDNKHICPYCKNIQYACVPAAQLSQNLHFLFNCREKTLTQRLFNYIDDNALINQLSASIEVGQTFAKNIERKLFLREFYKRGRIFSLRHNFMKRVGNRENKYWQKKRSRQMLWCLYCN
jgi:hypothetical protein